MCGKLPCYYLMIGRRSDQRRFATDIGFSMTRKQEKLVRGISLLGRFGPKEAAVEWKKLFKNYGRLWVKAGDWQICCGAPGGTFSE